MSESAGAELSKFLESDDLRDHHDYIFALSQRGKPRCREERMICAADQFILCVPSNGLFSYFELQPEHAAYGHDAFTDMGLPQFADVVAKGLELLSLEKTASAFEIETRAKDVVETELEQFLDATENYENLINDHIALIEIAIGKYIRDNAPRLIQSAT